MLDVTRLKAELGHIHRGLMVIGQASRGRSLFDEVRANAPGGTNAALTWQALFADCLRVVHTAVAADGEIREDEIEATYDLIFSAARHYSSATDTYREYAAIDQESARSFLSCYSGDAGMFGHRASHRWPGLSLCRRAAAAGERDPLERYERIMTWLIEEACHVGSVSESDPRWRGRMSELEELRRELALAAEGAKPQLDLCERAFLSPTRVFASVQQASSVFDDDPFDVESVHADARATFERMVDRAVTPSQHGDGGRMMLVLGDSGAGKTHLLRSFRRHVQEKALGFVAYVQMQSSSADYARYVLQHVVDSFARPYAGGAHTGLQELASGLHRLVGGGLASRIQQLTNGEDASGSDRVVDHVVDELVDELLAQSDLATFDPDLLRVLLHALRPDARVTNRVYKYLRCEEMTAHDRKWIGGVAPKLDADAPSRMMHELGRLAWTTQQAALILMVDQAELAGLDSDASLTFRRAIDAFHKIVSELPSAVAVIACLGDLYTNVRPQLIRSALDRLELDPPVQRLSFNRSYEEIQAIVAKRLAYLFAEHGAMHRSESPVYPIPESLLRAQVNRRTRDVLEACHAYQERCAAERRIITFEEAPPEVIVTSPIATAATSELDRIAAAWNDAQHASGITVPDEPEAILALVGDVLRACADELGATIEVAVDDGVARARVEHGERRSQVTLAITNKGYTRGAFAREIERLRELAKDTTPVAVRTLPFPSGPASSAAIAELLKAGGRKELLDESTLRVLAAYRAFRPDFAPSRVAEWRRRDRPMTSHAEIARILDVDAFGAAFPSSEGTAQRISAPHLVPDSAAPEAIDGAPPVEVQTRIPFARGAEATLPMAAAPHKAPAPPRAVRDATVAPERTDTGASASQLPTPTTSTTTATTTTTTTTTTTDATAAVAEDGALHVGTGAGFRAEPRTLAVQSFVRHVGVLGTTGSGKTTLALNLIEQLLERDIAVVLVDRKGDLAGYARPDWWERAADRDRAKRLADRCDARLFTPGVQGGGRPLTLSVIPDVQGLPEHERSREIAFAAAALVGMMGFGESTNDRARRAILLQAIELLASRRAPAHLDHLIDLIESRDDDLVARAARYNDRLFDRLVQDLETLRLSDGHWFDPSGEPLTADALIGRRGGKTPLSIVSTKFLGEIARIQSWVAHLVGTINRQIVRTPTEQLQLVMMFDEAEIYLPAGTAKPPSKEPLQDLLRRARASGLGVLLASQSPADFDFRSRDLLNTWFVGTVGQQTAISKVEALFEQRRAALGKLGTLDPGHFMMLQDGDVNEIVRAASLLRTEPVPEQELLAIASSQARRR